MEWMFATFKERHPNVTLDIVGLAQVPDVQAKVQTECGAGNCPDFIIAATPAMAAGGILLDLTDWMTTNSDRFIASAQEPMKIDGKNYGWSAEYGPSPMIWNTRALEKVGVTSVPTTWDDLKAAGEKLQGAGLHLTSMGVQPNTYFYSILFPMPGGKEAMDAGDWTADVVVAAFTKLAEIVPFLPPNDAENDWDASAKLFVTEQTAFEVNGTWTIGAEIEGEASPDGFKDVVEVTPFVDTGNGTSVYTDTFTSVAVAADTAKDDAQMAAVLELFDFWTSEEVAERFVSEAHSPMGVTTAKVTPELAGPLLASFYAAVDSAKNPFTLTAALRAKDEYTALDEASKALRLGQGAEKATEVFNQKMTG